MMEYKEKTCCFSGHREIPLPQYAAIRKRLRKTLEALIERGYCFFEAGGALGFDTLAAQTVLELKSAYPQIRLILVLPYLSQAAGWSDKDKAVYEDIKCRADKVVYTAQEYFRGCMHKRNRHLVDNSSVCICYLTKNTGGTAYTVDYADKNELQVINMA